MPSIQLPLLLLAGALTANAQTKVTHTPFGKLPDGSSAEVYTLTDAPLQVRVTTFGAHLVSVDTPDKNGQRANVVLGYDTLSGYLADTSTHMGAIVGRFGNRIAKGAFTLDGKLYHLPINNGPNSLHGGTRGFDSHDWTGKEIPDGVELTLVSPDGDQGYPGTLTVHVRYTLTADKLHIDYTATTDQPTVLNLTNHSYFNLSGHKRNILNDLVQINADRYTPVDSGLIPTGELAPVAGTPFDFRKPTPIEAHLGVDNAQLKIGEGYDHNWVLNPPLTLAKPAVLVTDPESGRILKVYTNQPGVQFYISQKLDGTFKDPSGRPFAKNDGFCFETQHFPDSPNQTSFPSTTLRPGQTYRSSTIFEFTTTK